MNTPSPARDGVFFIEATILCRYEKTHRPLKAAVVGAVCVARHRVTHEHLAHSHLFEIVIGACHHAHTLCFGPASRRNEQPRELRGLMVALVPTRPLSAAIGPTSPPTPVRQMQQQSRQPLARGQLILEVVPPAEGGDSWSSNQTCVPTNASGYSISRRCRSKSRGSQPSSRMAC